MTAKNETQTKQCVFPHLRDRFVFDIIYKLIIWDKYVADELESYSVYITTKAYIYIIEGYLVYSVHNTIKLQFSE